MLGVAGAVANDRPHAAYHSDLFRWDVAEPVGGGLESGASDNDVENKEKADRAEEWDTH